MVLLSDLSVVAMEVLRDGAMGLGVERLQSMIFLPPPRLPTGFFFQLVSRLLLQQLLSCSMVCSTGCKADTPNQLCKLWWFNSYGMKWLNVLCCEGGGRVGLLQGRDKTVNSHSKRLGHRYLIHLGTFELFSLRAQTCSQQKEWISIELENSLCQRSIQLIFMHLPP